MWQKATTNENFVNVHSRALLSCSCEPAPQIVSIAVLLPLSMLEAMIPAILVSSLYCT